MCLFLKPAFPLEHGYHLIRVVEIVKTLLRILRLIDPHCVSYQNVLPIDLAYLELRTFFIKT